MNPILAIDPGPEKSAWVEYHPETHTIYDMGYDENTDFLKVLRSDFEPDTTLVIEYITSYGMAVGASIFDTMFWTGRFIEAWDLRLRRWRPMTRPDIKLQLCGSRRAKDANIAVALRDRFPPTGGGATPVKGTKKQPGPLFGVSSHLWAALGVAVAWDESQNEGERRWDRMEAMV